MNSLAPLFSATFNIGGHVFQIPSSVLASDRGRKSKLYQAMLNNFDNVGQQVESVLNFDRDPLSFPLIVDFLCGKELQFGRTNMFLLEQLREEAAFFGIGDLVRSVDERLQKEPLGVPKSASEAFDDEHSFESHSSDAGSSSAQGSTIGSSPPTTSLPHHATQQAPARKRKASGPVRAAKRALPTVRAPRTAPAAEHTDTGCEGDSEGDAGKKCAMCHVSQSSGRRPMLWRRGPLGPKTYVLI